MSKVQLFDFPKRLVICTLIQHNITQETKPCFIFALIGAPTTWPNMSHLQNFLNLLISAHKTKCIEILTFKKNCDNEKIIIIILILLNLTITIILTNLSVQITSKKLLLQEIKPHLKHHCSGLVFTLSIFPKAYGKPLKCKASKTVTARGHKNFEISKI